MLSVFSCSPDHCYANYAISWCSRVADIKQTDSTRHWGREPQAVVSIRHAAGIMCAERGASSQSEEREGAI